MGDLGLCSPLQWRHNGHDGADQRKHQSSTSLAFVRGIHRQPVNSPHKWPVTRKMFPLDDVIMPDGGYAPCYTIYSNLVQSLALLWIWIRLFIHHDAKCYFEPSYHIISYHIIYYIIYHTISYSIISYHIKSNHISYHIHTISYINIFHFIHHTISDHIITSYQHIISLHIITGPAMNIAHIGYLLVIT